MPAIRIHHVQIAIPVSGEAEGRRFYGELLGLWEVAKPYALRKRGGAWFEAGDLQLHLGVDQTFRPAMKAHVALQVRELPLLRRQLIAQEYTVVDDDELPGYSRCYVSDPFGNRVELLEPL
ncbi:MAG: glyoxalase [Dehalococcoidia bacterium]|nr:glyoxalase [Dehalococcoidia bacterium]